MADLIADFNRLRLYGMAACYADALEHGQPAAPTATRTASSPCVGTAISTRAMTLSPPSCRSRACRSRCSESGSSANGAPLRSAPGLRSTSGR